MKKVCLLAVTLVALGAISGRALGASRYQLHILDPVPGHAYNSAEDINASGMIVGRTAPTMTSTTFRVCYWDAGGVHETNVSIQQQNNVAINSRGEIASGCYVWQNGAKHKLPTLIPDSTGSNNFWDINDLGQVAGSSISGSTHYYRACLWDETGIHDLGVLSGTLESHAHAVNNVGQVVGWSEVGYRSDTAFIWQNGVMRGLWPLPGYSLSEAYDLNDLGQVVGSSLYLTHDPGPPFGVIRHQACTWQPDGSVLDIGLAGKDSAAVAINDRGQILCSSFNADYWIDYGAYVWEDGNITVLDGLGGDTRAYGINANGWIVGNTYGPDGNLHAVVWEPVPEPSSLAVLLGGIAALRCTKQRKIGCSRGRRTQGVV